MTPLHPLLARLGLRYPIFQAPMAGVATPALAAAVSNAGGLGALGIGASSADQARTMIDATRALTDRPFNVNVFCHRPAPKDPAREAAWLARLAPHFQALGLVTPTGLREIYRSFLDADDVCDLLLAQRPAVVSFHFGLPRPAQLAALRQAGILTLATATSPQEARQIEAAGVDAIVAQGIEAGGHRGVFDPAGPDERLSTLVLVQRLRRETRLPIIAAGGVMDGRGIHAALTLGAAAAQLGTAFILCPESAADAAYRAGLQSERADTTRLTSALSGRPARGLLNRFIAECEATPEAAAPAAYPQAYDAAKQLHAAASRLGRSDYAAHWAGQGAPLARALPAATLMATLAEELAAARVG